MGIEICGSYIFPVKYTDSTDHRHEKERLNFILLVTFAPVISLSQNIS